LAPPPQSGEPSTNNLGAKTGQAINVVGNSIVREVPADNGTKPLPLNGHRRVASSVQYLAHCFELRPHPFLHGTSEKQELSRPRLPAYMRESKKIESLRLPLPSGTLVRSSKPAEAYQPCLFGVYFQGKGLKAPLEVSPELDCVAFVLETQRKIVGVTDNDDFTARHTLPPLLYPKVEHVVQVYVRK